MLPVLLHCSWTDIVALWHGLVNRWIILALHLKESEFPRLRQGIPHSRPLVHIMGPWPLGTHASCLKKSEGRFSHILEI